ncbi:MAG: helicase-exonuclease AddAB subunit AddB [Cellulosilyticaceae bacterium]
MKAKFILGRAGSKKTSACYTQIQEELTKDEYSNLIMLVPEQFNLQTQIELSQKLYPGLLRVEVISFKNLAQKVLKEAGKAHYPVIDDLEKVMILKRILEEHKKELSFFKKSYISEGFVDSVNRLMTIFEQNSIETETLEIMIEDKEATSIFQYKMKDIKNIYGWFNEYIAEKFITSEGTMKLLADHVKESKYLENTSIWIDGFYGFTTAQLQIVRELLKKAKDITITLPMDKEYGAEEKIFENNPFYESIKTYQKLINICDEEKAHKEVCLSSYKEEDVSEELSYLEQNYLKTYVKPFEKEARDVIVRTYANVEEEIEETAKQIVGLIRDEDYRYRDIAILVGDLGKYKSSLTSIFKEYNIPFFLDYKRDIHTNSLIAAIDSIMEIITTSWSYKGVLSFLRTNMTVLSLDEVDLLDNYLLEYGIKGKKKWQEVWEFGAETTNLEEINRIREKVISIIAPLEEEISKYKGKEGRLSIKETTISLYHFLESIKAYETLEKRTEQHKLAQNRTLELENSQIWGQVVEIFERLVDILGEEKVSVSTYRNILKTSFSYIKMGIIPPAKDQVLIGTIDRTRLPKEKALFILGINEGLIPKQSSNMDIFSEMDKITLTAVCKAKDSKRDRLNDILINQDIYGSTFLIYTALTRATHKLCASSVVADEVGKPMRPSIVFYKLKKLFKQGEIETRKVSEDIFAPLPTFGMIGARLREDMEGKVEEDSTWRDVVSWYVSSDEWKDKVRTMSEHILYTNQQHYLHKDTAKLLYDERLDTSISKLETFRNCACCYFIKYGIKAEERKLFKWNTAEIGTLFHSVLERYPEELQKRQTNWVDASNVQMDESVKSAVTYSINKYNRSGREDGRFKYTASKVEKMSKRAIRALTHQLRQGKFEPKEYEVNFGYEGMPPIEIQIDEMRSVLLKGQIDRVDVYAKENGEEYVKILDYKSGKKQFNLVELYYGLQLQLLLYLDSYIKINEKNKPAGMFYFHIDTTYVKYETGTTLEAVMDKQLKNFKLSGLVLEDEEIIRMMDEDGTGQIIPVKFNKDGSVAKRSSVADENQFEQLREFIVDKVRMLGKDILDGKVSANPYKLTSKDPCTYCKYQAICQFDTANQDNEYEVLDKIGNEEIWEHICNRKNQK